MLIALPQDSPDVPFKAYTSKGHETSEGEDENGDVDDESSDEGMDKGGRGEGEDQDEDQDDGMADAPPPHPHMEGHFDNSVRIILIDVFITNTFIA